MKRCKICNIVKPLDDFYAMAGMRDGHRNECKACNLAAKKARYERDPVAAVARVRRWQEANRDRVNANSRRRRRDPQIRRNQKSGYLKRKFGITIEQYEQILDLQGGACAICERAPTPGISLHVDHDHSTGRIRGLVCFRCNNAMGDLDDDPRLFGVVIGYLSPPRSHGMHERIRCLMRERIALDEARR